ncbi:zinc-binding dehydrogenase [Hydrogenophaga sp. YM1]|nr:zinc-binding dehydrogenase [Hydrogenophaga sp. YM1]
MKAWLSHTPGGPHSLALEEIPVPVAEGSDLLVKVEAVGVNFPDSLLLRDQYQVRPARPFSPGGEFCSVITDLGPDASGFSVGDVVVGRCVHGAMAQLIAIGSDRCQKVPAGIPWTDAAAFLFAYATAYHALRSAGGLVAGETVLVLGASGGVGSAAVDLARALGARVLVAVSSQEKLEFAKSCGAEAGIVYPPRLESAEQKKGLVSRAQGVGRRVRRRPGAGSCRRRVFGACASLPCLTGSLPRGRVHRWSSQDSAQSGPAERPQGHRG